MIGAGLKKCTPITRCGLEQAEAMEVIDSDEVLLASIQSADTMASSSVNNDCLMSNRSTMASMIRFESLSNSLELVH